jgi:competence protein ComEC
MNSPLIIITIAYILGVVIGKTVEFPVWISFLPISFLLGLTIWAITTKKNIRFLIVGLFFLLGLLNFQIRNLPPSKNDISNFPKNKYLALIGQVEDEPRVIEDRIFFVLRVNKVDNRKARGLVSVASRASKLDYGDKVEVKGKLEELESISNPGILSYADYLKNKGIHCRLRAIRSPPKILRRGGGNTFKRLSIYLKNRLMLIPQKTLPEPYSTLLSSIIFGSRASKTPAEIKETYKRAGVAHLLVASGMHLGILVGVCLFFVRSIRLPLGLGVLVTSVVNFLYALMTGFGPSILRAAIMAEIMLIGLLFEKEKEIYTSLAIAGFIILLFNPKALFDVGFQLSFAATWAIVYISPVINERFYSHTKKFGVGIKRFIPRAVSVTLSVAIAPVLATVPITLFHFSQASLIGVLTNVLLLPWVGIIVVLGFVSTVLGAIFLPLGEFVNNANLILLWAAHWIITALSSLPFAQVFLAPPKLPVVIGYYVGLAGMVEVLRRGRFPKINRFRAAVLVLAVVSILLWNAALSSATRGLTITVLDVGQGDSILVESPSGKRMLIDGGVEKMGQRVVVPFLLKKGINKLDMLVLTHPHDDHLGGLPAVLTKIKVNTVLDPGFIYKSKSYRRFLDLIEKNKIKYQMARGGQVIRFGENVKAQILHPTMPFLGDTNSDANNCAIVFRMQYGEFSMLFTGDNEREGEERILEMFPESYLSSTILKVGHHGSRTSTSDRFLAAVNPKIAVISCGKHNKFKHPHKSTLQRLKGIRTYRTDQHGAITISSDGRSFQIKTAKAQRR